MFGITKRFWKRLAIGLVILVAVALICNGVMAWRMESQLQERVVAIRAAGEPASIADLAPAPIPDDENAAVILARIEPRLEAFSKEYAQFYETPIGKQVEEAENHGDPLTKSQADAMRAILDTYSDVEQALGEAAKREKYGSQLNFSLNTKDFIDQLVKKQGFIRTVARLLSWRIAVLMADGQNEEAIRRGTQMYRLARLYESEPSMVAFLVAIAVRGMVAEPMYDALATGQVSPATRAALDEELARIDDPQRLVRTFKSERAISAGWEGVMPDQPYPLLAHTFGWLLTSYQIGAIDYSEEYVRLAVLPWSEVSAKLGPADSPRRSGHGVLADLLTPALRAVFQANARSVALSRALRIDIALRQFAEKNGREATGLAELELPCGVTIDPFSGEPLKLKHTDEGWMIYTVMDDGVDNGGNFKEWKDYGVAPRKLRSTE